MTYFAFAVAMAAVAFAVVVYLRMRPVAPMSDEAIVRLLGDVVDRHARRIDPTTLRALRAALGSIGYWRTVERERMAIAPPTDEQLLDEMEAH